ncbi:MAG: POTRA domain-containing protein, partial [Acidobacteriaceae bacterium]
HFIVRAAGGVSSLTPPAGRGSVQETSVESALAQSSDAIVANPRVELLTLVAQSEKTAAMREADLIQQRVTEAWTKAMPNGMNSRALSVDPKTFSRTHTAIEFSLTANGHISELVLVHASGQISLDRSAWSALTKMDLPPTVAGLPNRTLRYRITFAYDDGVANQSKYGERPVAAGADQSTYDANLLWPKDTALPPDLLVQVRTLTIISRDLPEEDRLRAIQTVEGRTYRFDELEKGILRNFQDIGYARAIAKQPQLSSVVVQNAQVSSANVAIEVSSGKRYRLEAIIFDSGRSFSEKQLKDAFNVPVGGEFDASALGKGLDRLRRLYGTIGHINFTAVPMLQFEENRSAVVLRVNIDEGDVFNFGRLFLAGNETRAGETGALLSAWKALSGKPYNGLLLSKWLVDNATFLPNDGKDPLQHVELHQESSTHRADFLLTFP